MPKHEVENRESGNALSGYTPLETRFRSAEQNRNASRKKLVRAILENPDDTFFLSSRELAKRYSVDAATIVRTIQALGYRKYAEFAADLRSHFVTRITPYTVLKAASREKRACRTASNTASRWTCGTSTICMRTSTRKNPGDRASNQPGGPNPRGGHRSRRGTWLASCLWLDGPRIGGRSASRERWECAASNSHAQPQRPADRNQFWALPARHGGSGASRQEARSTNIRDHRWRENADRANLR